MLNIHEIKEGLSKAYYAAHEESMATSEACFANPHNDELWKADALATAKTLALFDALDIVTQISWHSNETAEEIVNSIVKAVTFKAEYPVKKRYEEIEATAAKCEEVSETLVQDEALSA